MSRKQSNMKKRAKMNMRHTEQWSNWCRGHEATDTGLAYAPV